MAKKNASTGHRGRGSGPHHGSAPDAPVGGTTNITDGTSNTIIVGEEGALFLPCSPGGHDRRGGRGDGNVRPGGGGNIADGSSNTIVVGETNTIVDGTSNTIVVGETGGRSGVPLPSAMHHALCRDLDPAYLMRVRIHTGRLHCPGFPGQPLAYIRGTDIYLVPGRYDPYSEGGRNLLKRVLTLGARHYGPGRRFAFGFRRHHEIEA